MRIIIISFFLLSSSFANELSDLKNLYVNKELKTYEGITFLDEKNRQIRLDDFRGNLILLNFWATWCAPCKKEMPSLDLLQTYKNLDNLKIFPINVGRDNLDKSVAFFQDLEIKNLDIFFDPPMTLAKKFSLRGVPTSILINKEGLEFGRILGSIDFENEKFIAGLSKYN